MTQYKVIEKTCFTNAEKRLFKAVMRQIGDWKELYSRPDDYRDAGSGVSGFIYYSDTVKFARRHIADILSVLNDFENELGEPLNTKPKDSDETQLFNWYAWFALEHCVQKVIDFKEGCYV